jgi:hypothetical protein
MFGKRHREDAKFPGTSFVSVSTSKNAFPKNLRHLATAASEISPSIRIWNSVKTALLLHYSFMVEMRKDALRKATDSFFI